MIGKTNVLWLASTLVLLVGQTTTAQEAIFDPKTKALNDACLAKYNGLGGHAFYCNANGTRNEKGTSVFVSYTHNKGERIATDSLFKMSGVQKLLLYPDRVGALRLEGDQTFDNDLDGIKQMQDLQELLISGEFSNDCLGHLSELTNLKKLWIADTRITGASIGKLKTMDSLKFLYIDSKDLEAKDFVVLQELESLRRLEIPNSEEIENEVSKILPKCAVNQ